MTLAPFLFEAIVDRSLAEDISSGDLTTESCVVPGAHAEAHAVARSDLVVCGGEVFALAFTRLDPRAEVHFVVEDGTAVAKGARLWRVQGDAGRMLTAERTALNLAQRMCAVATTTRAFVEALPPGARTRIADTRKTMPGLRVLDRYSVRVGGGVNHRDDLGSAVLIKDNHIVAAGGVVQAIESARAYAPHTSRIECEIDTLEQLELALSAGADVVLLDNMSTAEIARAVIVTGGRATLEASGGITLERIPELAHAGVDVISTGLLTHGVAAVDIGLDFSP